MFIGVENEALILPCKPEHEGKKQRFTQGSFSTCGLHAFLVDLKYPLAIEGTTADRAQPQPLKSGCTKVHEPRQTVGVGRGV